MRWLEHASTLQVAGARFRAALSRVVVAAALVGVASSAACGEAGPFTVTVYTVTAADPSHVAVSLAIFNAGNSPGTPSCRLSVATPAGPGKLSFRPPAAIGTAKSVVVREVVGVPPGTAPGVGYSGVTASC